MGLSSHQSARSKTDEWLTPPDIIEQMGEFDLDPCSPVNRPWDTAKRHYTINDNGLNQPWAGRVWLNPPFGNQTIHWMRRMAEHGNGIALIPARTETVMFFETVWSEAHAVLFLKGRPHFYYVTGERAPFNSGEPMCLVAYGADNALVLGLSGLGHFCKLGR